MIRKLLAQDPRYYQITALSTLLLYGVFALDFGLSLAGIAAIFGASLLTQATMTYLFKLPNYDMRSAIITSLSLSLLLRVEYIWVGALAAFIAISSKFIIRYQGKHIFNPANLAIVALVVGTGYAWISPAQWGSYAWFAFLMACLGGMVVNRALRSDVTLAFLGFYCGLLLLRALWLGDPLAIPLHQMQSGALLLFAFFMISDPKTTPNSQVGRIIMAGLVAAVAFMLQFLLYMPEGVLYALTIISPIVPFIDKVLKGELYQWKYAKNIGEYK